MPGPTREQVLSWFDNVPLNDAQLENVSQLRDMFKDVALNVLAVCPESADRTRALRTLQDAQTQSVYAYTHNLEENHPHA